MALIVDDVIAYTGGRLADDDETQRKLDAALAACRAYCGWHVTPVLTGIDLTVDGPGGRVLALPTGMLTNLVALSEEDVAFDVNADLVWSKSGLVRKRSPLMWSHQYQGITVTMDHGFDTAPDFDIAVLELVDRMAEMVGTAVGASGAMVAKKVDDVAYQWATAGGDLLNHTLLDSYKIPILA